MSGNEEALAILGASFMMIFLVGLALVVLLVVARWIIFTKAGEKGWKSLIPIYSDYVQWRIGWKKTYMFWVMVALVFVGYLLISLSGGVAVNAAGDAVSTGAGGVPTVIGSILVLAGCVLAYVAAYKLFKSFGRGVGWFIGYIFIPNIMLLVLAFGSSEHRGAVD